MATKYLPATTQPRRQRSTECGPLGVKPNDDQGRDLREVTVPKEIAEFQEAVHPKDHRVFFGAMYLAKLGFAHRLLTMLPVNRDNALFPPGDFRDWSEIESWAESIADTLRVARESGACDPSQLN
jgi:menaquinone-dependent protoporphyrinogen oxidase